MHASAAFEPLPPLSPLLPPIATDASGAVPPVPPVDPLVLPPVESPTVQPATIASARLEELLADTDTLRSGVDASDWVNASGGSEPDAGGWYRRRWIVTASAVAPEQLVVASVLVTTAAGARLHVHDIRLVTVAVRPQ